MSHYDSAISHRSTIDDRTGQHLSSSSRQIGSWIVRFIRTLIDPEPILFFVMDLVSSVHTFFRGSSSVGQSAATQDHEAITPAPSSGNATRKANEMENASSIGSTNSTTSTGPLLLDIFENPADGELNVLLAGLEDEVALPPQVAVVAASATAAPALCVVVADATKDYTPPPHEDTWEGVADAAHAALDSVGDVPDTAAMQAGLPAAHKVSSNGISHIERPHPLQHNQHRLSMTLTSQSGMSYYGMSLSSEEALRRMPPSADGMIWYATIIPDQCFTKDSTRIPGLNSKDYDLETQMLKPRRPSLPLKATEFMTSLTRVDTVEGDSSPMANNISSASRFRWIFYGVLNGWPALRCFEVVAVEKQKKKGNGIFSIPSPRDLMTGQVSWETIWKPDSPPGKLGIGPSTPVDANCLFRARLKAPAWSIKGWSPTSPGFAFWFEAQVPASNGGPRLSYGTNMVRTVSNTPRDQCSFVHMASHRYAKLRESPRDRFVYHSVVLLEWEHGQYCTVVESAYLNGTCCGMGREL
jgi:hypothetical protein